MLNTIESANNQIPMAGAPLLCLVVDDSPTVRRIARRFIGEMGFVVEEAENGQLALRVCQVRMPELILLDWNMPEMNGLEFLIALRGMQAGVGPAVVFCTTESDVEHISTAIQSGADDYLVKPFDRESLKAKLEAVLDGRKAGQ